MLPAEHRLRRRSDFSRTVRTGRRAQRRSVVGHLLVGDAPGDGTAARVGFVVSRAVGGAVQRNRVRRRLRQLMRDRLGAVPTGACLVIRAQPAARERSAVELAADLDGVLGRLGRPRRDGGTSG